MKPSFKKIIAAAALAGIISAIVNSMLYSIFHAAGVISNEVYVQEHQPLTLLPVIFSSLVPSLLAGLVFYLSVVTVRMDIATFPFLLSFC
jgi:hypothetical protein